MVSSKTYLNIDSDRVVRMRAKQKINVSFTCSDIVTSEYSLQVGIINMNWTNFPVYPW